MNEVYDGRGTLTVKDGKMTLHIVMPSQNIVNLFHVNEANDEKGELTVKDGKMTIHVSLVSKKIVNLFAGTAEDAQKDGAKLIQPTTEEVTYSDGSKEEVYAFDVPVEALEKEFDLALIGTKGKWYDHKVSVSDTQAE